MDELKKKKKKSKFYHRQAEKTFKRIIIWLINFIIGLGLLKWINRGLSVRLKKYSYSFKVYRDELRQARTAVRGVDGCGNFTFTITGSEFKILQLTDLHIGGGFLSYRKDKKAIRAVADMIISEKPELVVVTGDIAYPFVPSSGAINNLRPAKIFSRLMVGLGVPWTFVFGNHDTENYAVHTRHDLVRGCARAVRRNPEFESCLFRDQSDEDVDGSGNKLIRILGKDGSSVRNLLLLDSHSYLDANPLGITFEYDHIKDSQVRWAMANILQAEISSGGNIPSCALFVHIPLNEYRDAWASYLASGNTEKVQYLSGSVGEKQTAIDRNKQPVLGIYSPLDRSNVFDVLRRHGRLDYVFCGHDHKNDLAIKYEGVTLAYSKSVDYLAYVGISKTDDYRGCNVITVQRDGSMSHQVKSYHTPKKGEKIPAPLDK